MSCTRHLAEIPSEQTDVIVIGAGSGLVAAIKVADEGAKVIVLDKLGPMEPEKIIPLLPGSFGNNTAKSGGNWFWMSNIAPDAPAPARVTWTKLEVEPGEKATQLAVYERLSRGKTDLELAKTLFERSRNDARWLRKEVGALQEKRKKIISGRTAYGRYMVVALYEAAKKRGIKILFEHKASKLLIDSKGAVQGVRAMPRDGLKDFKAKATILATGSFEGNHEMKLKYLGPEKANMLISGTHTNTGDGLKIAAEVGAKLVNMSATHIRVCDAVVHGIGPARMIPSICARGIFVNKNGRRFVDENRDSDDIANAIARQPEQKVYLIFDEGIRAELSREYESYLAVTIRDGDRTVTEEELMIKANTVEELAKKINVPYETLKETVEQFNAAVKDGKALGIPYSKAGRAAKIERPPFYAHPVTCALNHGLGGLKINTKGEVINTEDEVIPGLYACGAIINFHFGEIVTIEGALTYISSYRTFPGLGYSITSACLAGENAARRAKSIRLSKNLFWRKLTTNKLALWHPGL